MNPFPSGNMEDQLGELRARVRCLEEALERAGIPLPGAVKPRMESAVSSQESSGIPPLAPAPVRSQPEPVVPPSFSSFPQAQPEDARSLENQIGSQWFNRVGILAVLIGMAWFLKFAIDNHWIGPLGRILIGLLAGAALIAWSERFDRHGYVAFAYSLKAAGSGILYLSLWAAFSLYQLIPAGAAFAAMILITAFNGLLSWIRDAELLAFYAIIGGFSTPLLISTGENHEVALFCYLLLLDIAVLVLVVLRPWSRLLFAAFLGSVFYVAAWWFNYYSTVQFARTAFFLTCFFMIFACAPRLARIELDEAGSSAWDALAMVVLPIANAALGFLAFYALFDISSLRNAGPWIAVDFAAFYLVLLRLPAQGVWRASSELLSALHLAAAVVFLTLAIPLKAHGRWLTIGWLVEGAALLWVANRTRLLLLRVLAMLCLALGLATLLVINPPASVMPFLNQRFATYCVAIAVFALVAWMARSTVESEPAVAAVRWPALAAAAALITSLLILVAVGCEIHSYWWSMRWRGDRFLFGNYRIYAQFTYSAWFMIYGAILLAAGFWRRSAFLRWQALVLLALAIGKVFLVDMSALSQGLRILSFLGLGVLLLAVSFAYQRDWLNLRGQRGAAS
ncbi:MAG: DUF2339 domain-containing protein [Acidobacteriota bacterium]